jgi:hypothetical protein
MEEMAGRDGYPATHEKKAQLKCWAFFDLFPLYFNTSFKLEFKLRQIAARDYAKYRENDHDQQDDEQDTNDLGHRRRQGQHANKPPYKSKHDKINNKCDDQIQIFPFLFIRP